MTELARRDEPPGPLAALAEARAALEQCRDLGEVRDIRDVALAAKEYARAKRMGTEAVGYAQEIVNRAERRIGQLLAVVPKDTGKVAHRGKSKESNDGELSLSIRQQAGKKLSARAQRLALLDEETFERHVRKPVARLDRIIRDRAAEQARIEQARREAGAQPEPCRVDIRHGDFREVLADLSGVDAVITDPPYSREFLPLLGDLAAWADKVLKPDGVLVVLMGQAHLPEVYRLLDGHRPYRWTGCYLSRERGYNSYAARVQCGWKPLLVYGGGPRFSDVIRTEGSGADARDHHRWGQDFGAFCTIIERLTKRGQTVCDPFTGSGTTLLAASALGRHVTGADTDPAAVDTAVRRLALPNPPEAS